MRALFLLLPLLGSQLAPRRAHADLASAQAAIRELRYDEARQELGRLVEAGGLEREALLSILELLAEASAVVDGPEAGERDYRRLLALDSARAAPRRDTPVFRIPFERARRWVEASGKLEVAVLPEGPGAPRTAIRVDRDPLALVWGLRCWIALDARARFAAGPNVVGTTAALPAPPAGGAVLYYIDVIDEHGNQLLTIGSPSEPLRWTGVPLHALPAQLDLRPPRRVWRPGLALTLIGAASLAAAIGFDAAAVDEFERLRVSCAPGCMDSMLDTFRVDGAVAGTFYAIGAAGLAVGVTLLIVDTVRMRRHRERTASSRR